MGRGNVEYEKLQISGWPSMEIITERFIELLSVARDIAIVCAVIMCLHRAMTRNDREPFSDD